MKDPTLEPGKLYIKWWKHLKGARVRLARHLEMP